MDRATILQKLISHYEALLNDTSCQFVGLAGGQGIGKSYLSRELKAQFGEDLLVLSLDDFYLTKAVREKLALQVHPMLATRGVPGTHDLDLLRHVLDRLMKGEMGDGIALPHFIKAHDDRAANADWQLVTQAPKLILLEGWCVGAQPQTESVLATPINALEECKDKAGQWRAYVNAQLRAHYLPIWLRMAHICYLKPLSFSQIFDWRWQQEIGNLAEIGQVPKDDDRDRIAVFIQHYERITRQMMAQKTGFDMVIEVSGAERAWQLIKG